MPFIALEDGTRLHYWERGVENEKKLLLMLPPMNVGEYDTKLLMDGMSGDFHCIAIDFRGYGRSQDSVRSFSSSAEDMHQDAADAKQVMEILGHRKYSVLGLSDGSAAAVILAAQQSACVETLITMGGNCYVSDYDKHVSQSFGDPNLIPEERKDELQKVYGENLSTIWEKYMNSYNATHARPNGNICMEEAKRVTCPTLAIYGEQDWTIEKSHREFFRSNVLNCTVHIYPEGPHYVHLFAPEEFNRIVMDFIKKH